MSWGQAGFIVSVVLGKAHGWCGYQGQAWSALCQRPRFASSVRQLIRSAGPVLRSLIPNSFSGLEGNAAAVVFPIWPSHWSHVLGTLRWPFTPARAIGSSRAHCSHWSKTVALRGSLWSEVENSINSASPRTYQFGEKHDSAM